MENEISGEYLIGLEDKSTGKVPEEIQQNLRFSPRAPANDPTLGISVVLNRDPQPEHRLVAIGDSVTHGFQSGAIFNTSLSYPMLIARELGWSQNFRFPGYESPGDGLPLNLEKVAREMGDRFQVADGINAIDAIQLLPWFRGYLDRNEDFWEREVNIPTEGLINHNLGVYGWDLRNTLSRHADIAQAIIAAKPPKDDPLAQIPEHANEIATLKVLNTARNESGKALTPLQAAQKLSQEGEGIETLIVFIGANNALGSIFTLNLTWSGDDFADMDKNDKYTVWLPSHFQQELDLIVAEVKKIKARHVIWGTVPHVTILPFARGIGHGKDKIQPGSRYFPFYVPVWIQEADFNPKRHPHLTANQARGIDSAIDQYNESIVAAVRSGRLEGRDWYVFESAGLLDRLASRRYIADPSAKPDWWTPYPLPEALENHPDGKPTSLFFTSNSQGRQQGGLFSLDGIHPTTIGYGIIAQEIIKIMQLAGVKFYESDGVTQRSGAIELDFEQLIAQDTLISQPPEAVAAILDSIGWLDGMTGIISGLYKSNL
jgi:hypothetical protein